MRGAPALLAAALAATLAAASAGCADGGIGVADVTGAWVRVDPLPATAQFTATSDSVFFFDREGAGPGRGLRRVSFREGGGDAEVTNGHFAFRVADGEVLVTFDCPADADCLPGPHLRGTVDGAMLTLRPAPASGASPTRYRRVSRSRPASW